MASTRKMKRKRLRFHGSPPGASDHVDIPVIEEISFRDPKTNQQEYGFRFKNNENDTRKVHVRKVRIATISGGNVLYDENKYIDVERIETISFKDPKTNMQEYGYRLRNNDPPPLTPEGDDGGELRHRKVQFVRYTKDNTESGSPWVDVEQYVEFEVKDPKTDMQEFVYRLNWGDFQSLPKIIDATDPYAVNTDLRLGFCDPGLELFPEIDGGSIDPPWRIDPFQNIVNMSGPPGFADGFKMTWAYNFDNQKTVEGGTQCNDPSGEIVDFNNIWISGTSTYSFPLIGGGPQFDSGGNPHITPGTTTVSGSPTVPPSDTSDNCVGFGIDGVHIILGTSANITIQKGVLEGDASCHNTTFNSPKFGIVSVGQPFNVSADASGISATLLGKPADRTTTRIEWSSSGIIVTVGFSWDFPPGFDWNVGWT